MRVQRQCADILVNHMCSEGLVGKCLAHAEIALEHVMDFTRLRALNALFSMVNYNVRFIQQYNSMHSDFPMSVC